MKTPTLSELRDLLALANHPDQSPCDALRFDQESGDYVRVLLSGAGQDEYARGVIEERERCAVVADSFSGVSEATAKEIAFRLRNGHASCDPGDERKTEGAKAVMLPRAPPPLPDGFAYGDELPGKTVEYILNENFWRADASRESIHALALSHKRVAAERDEAKAKVALLTEALEWYGDKYNHREDFDIFSNVHQDVGERARVALAKVKP